MISTNISLVYVPVVHKMVHLDSFGTLTTREIKVYLVPFFLDVVQLIHWIIL